jgi:hypothetical protein
MDMSEVFCPSWCVNGSEGSAHAHVSTDIVGGAADQPLIARLIRMEHSDDVHVLMNDRVASLSEAATFVGGLRSLLDKASLAEPGLSFVTVLADRAGLSLEQLAELAEIAPDRVQEQAEGGQVLSRNEVDRLALTAASQVADSLSPTG